jgi:hypothetical protein
MCLVLWREFALGAAGPQPVKSFALPREWYAESNSGVNTGCANLLASIGFHSPAIEVCRYAGSPVRRNPGEKFNCERLRKRHLTFRSF